MKLKIAGLQYNPVLGQVEKNISRIRALVGSFKQPIDLLVLPELAVTGYNFKSPTEISPYLESQGGPSYLLAKELSSRFHCTTVIGYPENLDGTTYNSALVVDEEGQVVFNYRKTHLYETDEAWGCSENPIKTFPAIDLLLGKGNDKSVVRTNVGICMDLNPYQFTAPFTDFEFSLASCSNGARLLIIPTAWLNSKSPDIQEELLTEEKGKQESLIRMHLEQGTFPDAQKPDLLLIDYWIMRLFPFSSLPSNGLPDPGRKVTAVICNRTGIEHQTFYGGSSCFLQFDRSIAGSEKANSMNPSVSLLCAAGRTTEEIIYHEVDI